MLNAADENQDPARLYIALYKLSDAADNYHWGIVAPSTNRLSAPTQTYHIINSTSIISFSSSTGWKHGHQVVAPLEFERFHGFIRLPPLIDPARISDVRRIISEYEPVQSGVPLLIGRSEWDCVHWVVHVIGEVVRQNHLSRAEFYYPHPKWADKLYNNILKAGAKARHRRNECEITSDGVIVVDYRRDDAY
ncbi:hypothetical protein D9615_010164 [Tricholomella constricta]|uniref:Uncharacterized protein n=1 Tax=Tricholomella constricta TaxID=117010 RepID=A0A8H5GRI9_9AGAR|nr:hypothetical protein D9615_010164 [Tricholomella constricta]